MADFATSIKETHMLGLLQLCSLPRSADSRGEWALLLEEEVEVEEAC